MNLNKTKMKEDDDTKNSSMIVHFTWNEDRNDEFPRVLEYRQLWIDAGYTVKVTPNADIRKDVLRLEQLIKNETLFKKLLKTFDDLQTDNMRYDFWRYTKLYLEGGIYADVDVQPRSQLSEWYMKSTEQGKPVFFEGSNWPHWGIFQWLIPKISDYQEIPSWDTCLVLSAQPGSDILVELLDAMNITRWQNAPEPKRTLMTVGPGMVSEFLRSRDEVIKVGFLERRSAYLHKGFGTWKARWGSEYYVMARMVAFGLFLWAALKIWTARKHKWRKKEKVDDCCEHCHKEEDFSDEEKTALTDDATTGSDSGGSTSDVEWQRLLLQKNGLV